jgi:predicted phage terminase large subunit-like protein
MNLQQLSPQLKRQVLRKLLLDGFGAFVRMVFRTLHPNEVYLHNWHIDLLCGILAPLRERKRLRKVINLPPRSLKSIIVSVALPAWLLGHDPSRKIVVVSYSEDLAKKLSIDFAKIITSGWYRDAFSAVIVDKKTELEITTTLHGYRLATSTGGTLTGRGGALVILDDPIKPADAESEVTRRKNNDWFDQTLYARLDSKKDDSIILVMQRLHQDDLSGHMLEKGGFDHLRLPAIATEDETWRLHDRRIVRRKLGEALHSERESLATLAEIRRSQGSRVFQGQYQQEPVSAEGTLFKRIWLQRYEAPPPSREIVQSWDTATALGPSNDYSVGTTWAKAKNVYYLLHVLRGRWDFPELLKQVQANVVAFRAGTVLVEDANSGSALLQTLRPNCPFNLIARKPRLEKLVRASAQAACFEAGRVLLPREAAWLVDYETELLGFPSAKYDDQVDSTVQFLEWAEERNAYATPMVMPIVITGPRPWD